MKNYLNYMISFGILTIFLGLSSHAQAGTSESWSYGAADNSWRIDFKREVRGNVSTTSYFSATVVSIRGQSAPVPAGDYKFSGAAQYSGEKVPNPEGAPVDSLLNAMSFRNLDGSAGFTVENLGSSETNFRFGNHKNWSEARALKLSIASGPIFVVEPAQYAQGRKMLHGAPTTAGGWIKSAAKDGVQVAGFCVEALATIVTAPFRWFR